MRCVLLCLYDCRLEESSIAFRLMWSVLLICFHGNYRLSTPLLLNFLFMKFFSFFFPKLFPLILQHSLPSSLSSSLQLSTNSPFPLLPHSLPSMTRCPSSSISSLPKCLVWWEHWPPSATVCRGSLSSLCLWL